MSDAISKIVIVGGGTAGWMTACLIAAEHAGSRRGISVTLIESPDVPIIGVGEGTWPSMRSTLQKIGLSEDALICETDASFKQGTCFQGWSDATADDRYYHPFSPPIEYSSLNLAGYWLQQEGATSFSDFVTPQAAVIAEGLAPKQTSTPPYAFAVNYAYHLDAGKFAHLLHRHGVERLGVQYLSGNLASVRTRGNGDLEVIQLDTGEQVAGDIFIDCTGQRALLIGEHFKIGFKSLKQYLFNDAAIAVQAPYAEPDAPIASVTQSTATEAGWIWDIGLQTRRGLGHVFSSAHLDAERAIDILRSYAARTTPEATLNQISFRELGFQPGYRDCFWINNCVAVGLSAGFVEPLEASAIALIEQSAHLLSRQLPANREIMAVVAKRFNQKMHYHWLRIVDFLKLHYAISRREDSGYWRDVRSEASWPEELREKLVLWQQQAPWHDDAPMVDELFPSASYQYVLYGMGYRPSGTLFHVDADPQTMARADAALHEKNQKTARMCSLLPTNRTLIESIKARYAGQRAM